MDGWVGCIIRYVIVTDRLSTDLDRIATVPSDSDERDVNFREASVFANVKNGFRESEREREREREREINEYLK